MEKNIFKVINGTLKTGFSYIYWLFAQAVKCFFAFFSCSFFVKRGFHKYFGNFFIKSAVESEFINGSYGSWYGIRKRDRKKLVKMIHKQSKHVTNATNILYHTVLAKEILSIPKEIEGVVVECGAFKGSTSVTLSLACKLAGRKLIVCDSFEGLPDEETDLVRDYTHLQIYGYYEKGMYEGTLDEVKSNISNYGAIEVCEFNKGFFSDSLKNLKEPVAFAFFDVDLTSSIKDCIKYIWPLMAEGAKVYTDDSCDMEVVKVWFDDTWWKENLGRPAPGYVGSGCGLPLDYDFSSLGYTSRISDITSAYGKTSWLRYKGEGE